MSRPSYFRRKRLIKPSLQWKLIGSFIGILLLGMLLQYMLLAQQLTELASILPSDSDALIANTPALLTSVFWISLLVLLPITILVGVTVTFRIAGPVYRFEQHLGAIARGEQPGTCKIRKTDELSELCTAINAAVEKLQTQSTESKDETRPGSEDSSELRRAS
ncbi:MAG: methyl-accepting chemotaxis protein [Planctomycetota bacterium]|jgi:methyl-accepting chemotaxis protein